MSALVRNKTFEWKRDKLQQVLNDVQTFAHIRPLCVFILEDYSFIAEHAPVMRLGDLQLWQIDRDELALVVTYAYEQLLAVNETPQCSAALNSMIANCIRSIETVLWLRAGAR